ncbi:MAG: phenylalanine--tRNA ligase subunit alpha [Alphaproteobacteria bacterium]|nr:phenylalanine--tRNA ligase subunit alpha [Alphaproteobacteria bacterium]MDA8003986.1 phenylalanine--tRNA ligase subunit alpha [Alphaproteobacteria bacterium]MDA8005189.1 phenylalanine--tRNA ligase subunit alpha [Alphaproteobacteria bacterium]MDA8012652.1 phenylalanine--tRNA ligase subunit alpha [Alphaproteobacteria bacterium]
MTASESPEELAARAGAKIAAATNTAELETLRVAVLGKNGEITQRLRAVRDAPPEERRELGLKLNRAKNEIENALNARRDTLALRESRAALVSEKLDATLPAEELVLGHIHPVHRVIEEIVSLCSALGFTVAEGPDIEDGFHAFSALNIPPWHPARQDMDTFYLKPDDNNGAGADEEHTPCLLRPHTSSAQIRTMLSSPPPLRIVAPGRTFRSDSDATHAPMFHQLEALVVEKDVHMGHLRGTIETFLRGFFQNDSLPIRFRPSHFPFTEPSAEVDVGYHIKDDTVHIGSDGDGDGDSKWMEILGCGMVHPNVLKNCGVSPDKWQGFAWGIGIERLAILKYGAPDLRAFMRGDLDWLRRYGFRPWAKPAAAWGE